MWRPEPRIRVKALGLVWRDGSLLAAEVLDDRWQTSRSRRAVDAAIKSGEFQGVIAATTPTGSRVV